MSAPTYTYLLQGKDVTVSRVQFYHVFAEDLQQWLFLPFTTFSQEAGADILDCQPDDVLFYRQAATAEAIKRELVTFVPGLYRGKTMKVFKAAGKSETPVPETQGGEIDGSQLVSPNAWLMVISEDIAAAPEPWSDEGWPSDSEWEKIGNAAKMRVFIQEEDDWKRVTLPPKTDSEELDCGDGEFSPGSTAIVSTYNCKLLKHCIVKSLGLPLDKEGANRLRIYKCGQGQAIGHALKNNVLINIKDYYVCATSPDTPVDVLFQETQAANAVSPYDSPDMDPDPTDKVWGAN